MGTMKNVVKGLGLGVVLLAGTGALAGAKYARPVYVSSSSGAGYAYGSLGTARSSTDVNQYIGCTTSTGSSGEQVMNCFARSAGGISASCTSSVSALVNAAHSVTADSYIDFRWDGTGACTQLTVTHASYMQPSVP
ncbi:hypothetical protein POL68_30745 [Stigmatella sp. ncwal1]|uniref:Uncharacterized protein n=1 Tax=Stigmatella ashevillensis TaxID=2995309 RepID=A0ABT5DIA5_9BACT|nr:hypothetical protein [Stigmatella ashevillena]MDC0712880.1 hypothetical protein [Stigmatella ashevillena]